MQMFRLRKNAPDFEVVDGPFTGRTFRAGETYAEIPPEEASRFEAVAPRESLEDISEKEKGGRKK